MVVGRCWRAPYYALSSLYSLRLTDVEYKGRVCDMVLVDLPGHGLTAYQLRGPSVCAIIRTYVRRAASAILICELEGGAGPRGARYL